MEGKVKFKKGDKIDIGTGFYCDTGKFLRYENNESIVVWESVLGGIYKTPISMYNVTKLKKDTPLIL